MRILHLLAASVAVGALAVPASAQTPYAYPYAQPVPQPYPGQPGYGYAYPGYQQPYGYPQQGYGTNPVEQIINQLLGNNTRYTVSDRTLVSRCAIAAVAQAEAQYRPRYGSYGQPYGQAYGYNRPYANAGYANPYAQMRVTAITDVERRSSNGLRIKGLIDSGAYATSYGNRGYGSRYADPRYAQAADLSFRCNVDSRGAVSDIRVNRTNAAYRR